MLDTTAPHGASPATSQTSPSDVAIRVADVSKHYRIYARPEDRLIQMATLGRVRRFQEFSALKSVSLTVGHGETVGIIGRNGCGKSTLLQIICGTLRPSSGQVQVNGRVAALLELGAGFNGEFTGRENVYMNGAILGFSREEMDARFEQIAQFAGIGQFIEQPVKTYSSGMFVRLAFAVATAVEPDILVVDEALSVGDEAFQRKCFARIEAIKERGGTILFVSHGAQTIVQLCDRAVLLDAGEKILEGTPKAVVTQYQRLVNASAEAYIEIRNAIVAFDPSNTVGTIAEAATSDDTTSGSMVPAAAPDFLDPALCSQSMVSLEERGAQIFDVQLQTLEGHPVNTITLGRRYEFVYKIRFSVSASGIGFGMFFKTVDGIGLAGIQTIFSKPAQIHKVEPGTIADIKIEFSCSLLPKAYFITCGVFGKVQDEEILMHRIIDALAVRVQPEPDLFAIGHFDLNAIPRATLRSEGQ